MEKQEKLHKQIKDKLDIAQQAAHDDLREANAAQRREERELRLQEQADCSHMHEQNPDGASHCVYIENGNFILCQHCRKIIQSECEEFNRLFQTVPVSNDGDPVPFDIEDTIDASLEDWGETDPEKLYLFINHLSQGSITINGVTLSGDALIQTLNQMTNPDPKRWFRFERHGSTVTVHTRIDDDQTPNHNPDLPSVLG